MFLIAAAIGMMAPIVLFFRLRDNPSTWPITAGRSTRPQRGRCAADIRPTSSCACCSRSGNSSDAFLLVRAHEVGWSATALPLLWAFHHLVKSLAAVPGGALSDRHSRAVVVSFGWAAYALTYVGFGFASQRWQILVLFLVYALYHGLAEGAERAIIADLSERGARGRAYGLYHGLVGVAALPAGIGTGLVWDKLGTGLGAGRERRVRGAGVGVPVRADVRRAAAPRPGDGAVTRERLVRARGRAAAARAGCAAPRATRSEASRRPAPR